MNEKCNLVTVLLLCCLIFPGNAQEFNWQDLVNRKQYAAVIAHADSLTYRVFTTDYYSIFYR